MNRDNPSDIPCDIAKSVILICVLLITYLMASGAVREWMTNPLGAKSSLNYERVVR